MMKPACYVKLLVFVTKTLSRINFFYIYLARLLLDLKNLIILFEKSVISIHCTLHLH